MTPERSGRGDQLYLQKSCWEINFSKEASYNHYI